MFDKMLNICFIIQLTYTKGIQISPQYTVHNHRQSHTLSWHQMALILLNIYGNRISHEELKIKSQYISLHYKFLTDYYGIDESVLMKQIK